MAFFIKFKTPNSSKRLTFDPVGSGTCFKFQDHKNNQVFYYHPGTDKTQIISSQYTAGFLDFLDVPGVHARLFLSEAANKRLIK
jgi:hypothetical protein